MAKQLTRRAPAVRARGPREARGEAALVAARRQLVAPTRACRTPHVKPVVGLTSDTATHAITNTERAIIRLHLLLKGHLTSPEVSLFFFFPKSKESRTGRMRRMRNPSHKHTKKEKKSR